MGRAELFVLHRMFVFPVYGTAKRTPVAPEESNAGGENTSPVLI